jgi:hypothetical protein
MTLLLSIRLIDPVAATTSTARSKAFDAMQLKSDVVQVFYPQRLVTRVSTGGS